MSDKEHQDETKDEHETRDNIINWIFAAGAVVAGGFAGVASVVGVGVAGAALAVVSNAKEKPDKMLLGASFGFPAALALVFGLSAMD